ncbi:MULTISPECIES: hypothetical protein [unclassified Bradyrhizobium]|uniref:hypothetical protein n=1 Tax=unclassified Bradyrhizobium TaxID=2631580 RepID=UPI002305BC01|nr:MULTISPECIES: hypothetical protein [unclassified Bradyrhizobium]
MKGDTSHATATGLVLFARGQRAGLQPSLLRSAEKKHRENLRGKVVLLEEIWNCRRGLQFMMVDVISRTRQCDSKANMSCYFMAPARQPINFSFPNQRGDSFSRPGVNLEARG